MSQLTWPYFAEDEINAATEVLRSGKVNYWTGDFGKKFECEFAGYIGCRYAVALANGTVALELALHALGIGAGDEVILPPRTFLASASAIVRLGAVPIFADVDFVSQNVTAETIAPKITANTKAILCVHLAGWPCEMDKIMALAEMHDLYVVEDCAQAHGAEYQGKRVGSWGHVAAFSFCQDKIMTTGGEGGMLTTNDEAIWKKAWSFKDHGKCHDTVFGTSHPPGFRWLHKDFGTNWRMTEMQAAIGLKQLAKLPAWLAKRRQFAQQLNQALAGVSGVITTVPPSDVLHAYYKYYILLDLKQLRSGWDKAKVQAAIEALGVPCFYGSCSEIYLEEAFGEYGLQPKERLPVAQQLGEVSLMFQVHPTLETHHVDRVITVVKSIMHRAVA